MRNPSLLQPYIRILRNFLLTNTFLPKSPKKMRRYKAKALRREVLIMTAVEDHITTAVEDHITTAVEDHITTEEVT